jgi:hypothetical protein
MRCENTFANAKHDGFTQHGAPVFQEALDDDRYEERRRILRTKQKQHMHRDSVCEPVDEFLLKVKGRRREHRDHDGQSDEDDLGSAGEVPYPPVESRGRDVRTIWIVPGQRLILNSGRTRRIRTFGL